MRKDGRRKTFRKCEYASLKVCMKATSRRVLVEWKAGGGVKRRLIQSGKFVL